MFLFDLPQYIQDPGQIFTLETLQAAGVFHGGFIVALITAVVVMRRHKMPLLSTMDVFAPGIVIGQAIGRIGCFAAGCCWGTECDLPWGVRFRSDFAAPVPLNKTLHPVQLYESALNVIVFVILYRVCTKEHRPGQVIGWYLVLYSSVRFFVEFFRVHEQALVGPFSITQWISLGLFALGAGILLHVSRKTADLKAAAAH
jgi:phosphatidylglycerol:prolipoprotein diacylglycerol transferase